ncbi:MAG: hypothetical protein Phog2KO_01090 [Phototrophicaceae bacterium]
MSEQTSQVLQLSDSVKLEIHENGSYWVYTLSDSANKTIDVYIDDVLARLNVWEGGDLFVLHDISNPNVNLTRYFQRRLDEVADYLRKSRKSGYSAVILSNTFVSQIISIFAQLFNRKNGEFEQLMFTDLESGKKWIAEKSENKVYM